MSAHRAPGATTKTLVELCAGGAACSLYALGGRRLLPPVAWMGGKRRLAPDILAALGVDRRGVDRIVLVDASTWGWVWPVLLAPDGDRVSRTLRRWGSERGARELWDQLVQQPPMQDTVERAAQWLWLQARSASGVPVWWGPELDSPEGWMASDGRGVPREAGQRGGAWVNANGRPGGSAGEPRWRPANDKGEDRRWVGGGMMRPATIADRIDSIRSAIKRRNVHVSVVHGDVLDFEPVPESHVVFDPPYQGRTGYGWKLPRAAVLEVAKRHKAAGARVVVCEAEPLDDLRGWPRHELPPGRASDEWLTMSHPHPARRQASLFDRMEVA